MSYFIILHAIAALIYIFLGGFILSRDVRSGQNRVFSGLCGLFGLWATSFAVMHASRDINLVRVAYNVSAPAWCLYSGMSAHVLLYIAGEKFAKSKWAYPAMYSPGILLVVLQWTGRFQGFDFHLLDAGWVEVPLTTSPWYWFFLFYQVAYIVSALFVLARWGLTSRLRREKKQAAVLTVSIAVTFSLCFLTDILLPYLGLYLFPSVSALIIVILAIGTLVAIVRYQMLSVSLAYASGEILKRIKDMVALLSPSGEILRINAWAGEVLGYTEQELAARPYVDFIEERDAFLLQLEAIRMWGLHEFSMEATVMARDGARIPHGISGSVIRDRENDIIALLVIGNDLTEKRSLQREILEREATAEALRLSQEGLRLRNDEIEGQLRHAQNIQKALLPRSSPGTERVRVEFRSSSMDAVGGDYFAFAAARQGLGVLIGDVSGHGVSAALFLALLKSESERIFRANYNDPSHFMAALNGNLIGSMPGHYLTAIYGFFSWEGKGPVVFDFAKGGHPEPVLGRKGARPEYVSCKGPILGQFPGADFPAKSLEIGRGDRLFFYTDGLVETRNSRGLFFGYPQLLELIDKTGDMDLAAALNHIIAETTSFRGSTLVEDDVVLIGCEIT